MQRLPINFQQHFLHVSGQSLARYYNAHWATGSVVVSNKETAADNYNGLDTLKSDVKNLRLKGFSHKDLPLQALAQAQVVADVLTALGVVARPTL